MSSRARSTGTGRKSRSSAVEEPVIDDTGTDTGKKVSMFTVDRKSKMPNGKNLFVFNPDAIYCKPTRRPPPNTYPASAATHVGSETKAGGKSKPKKKAAMPPSPAKTPYLVHQQPFPELPSTHHQGMLFEMMDTADQAMSDMMQALPDPNSTAIENFYHPLPVGARKNLPARRHSISCFGGDSTSSPILPAGMKREHPIGNSPPLINKRVSFITADTQDSPDFSSSPYMRTRRVSEPPLPEFSYFEHLSVFNSTSTNAPLRQHANSTSALELCHSSLGPIIEEDHHQNYASHIILSPHCMSQGTPGMFDPLDFLNLDPLSPQLCPLASRQQLPAAEDLNAMLNNYADGPSSSPSSSFHQQE